MGPAASKVYFAPKGLSIGGYGEIFYRNHARRPQGAQRLRPVPRRPLHRLPLHAEDPVQLGGRVRAPARAVGRVRVPRLPPLGRGRLRVGNVLVPMGFVNELHEPPFFNGVFRPDGGAEPHPDHLERERRSACTARSAPSATRPTASSGLNGASGEPRGRDLAARRAHRRRRGAGGDVRGRREPRLRDAGRSASRARSTAGAPGRAREDDQGEIHADVTLAEAHAQLAWRGLQLRGLLRDGLARRRGAALGAAGTTASCSGRARAAATLEAAYDVLSGSRCRTRASRSRRSSATRCSTSTTRCRPASRGTRPWIRRSGPPGLTYKPHPDGGREGRLPAHRHRRGHDALEQVNFGVGYVF